MNWIQANPQLAMGVSALLAAAIGYSYRAWRAHQGNLREALYLLLEIWHRSSVVLAPPILERQVDELLKRIELHRPDIDFSDTDKDMLCAHFVPILDRAMRAHTMHGIDSLYGAYEKAVQLIAHSAPLLAYDLDSASSTKRGLTFLDQYLEESFAPFSAEGGETKLFFDSLGATIRGKVGAEALEDFEKNVRRLAIRVGPCVWIGIVLRIRRRRRLLAQGLEDGEFDKMFEDFLLPAIDAAERSAGLDGAQLPEAPGEEKVGEKD